MAESEELSFDSASDIDNSSYDGTGIVFDFDEEFTDEEEEDEETDDNLEGFSIPSGSTLPSLDDDEVVGSDQSLISLDPSVTIPDDDDVRQVTSDGTSEIDIIDSDDDDDGSGTGNADAPMEQARPPAPEPRTPSLPTLTPPPPRLRQQGDELHAGGDAQSGTAPLLSPQGRESTASLPSLPSLPSNTISPRRSILDWVRDSARVTQLTISDGAGAAPTVTSAGPAPESAPHSLLSQDRTVANPPTSVATSPRASTSALHSSPPNLADREAPSGVSESNQSAAAPSVNTTSVITTSSSSATEVAASRTLPLSAVDSSRLNSSVSEFRSPKRKRVESPTKSEPAFDEEAESCTICFEAWSNSGNHRLCSLKCGHLFGQSCIVRWLKGTGVSKCPQCNAKANKKDIRIIFARALRVLDTAERDRAVEMLEEEKKLRQKAEMDAAQARLRHQMALDECNRLKQDIERQRQLIQHMRSSSLGGGGGSSALISSGFTLSQLPSTSKPNSPLYRFDQIIKISESGNCRVMGYCDRLATLVISQPSNNPLFPGFGIKKISSMDFKTSQYVSLHSKAIRDISFNTNNDGLLLSCSMDKTIKMTSLAGGNTTVHSYHCDMPLWSCVWNYDDKNYFFGGLQNGIVSVFDIRNTAQHVSQLSLEGSRSPVVSLQYVAHTTGDALRCGGLLVGQLDRATFYEARPDGNFRPHVLPVDGNIVYVSVEGKTKHMLTSHRPSPRCPAVAHQLYSLRSSTDASSGNLVVSGTNVQILRGGGAMKQLARSRLILQPDDDENMLVCAPDEASSGLLIWDAGTGGLRQKLGCQAPVLDVCPININEFNFLAALTEKNVHLHRWS